MIPSLVALNTDLNPDETVHVTASETSWLCELFVDLAPDLLVQVKKIQHIYNSIFPASFAHIAHPIGSILSGPLCDKIGRRKAIMLVSIPFVIGWTMLSLAQSFSVICCGFVLLGFCMGLKEAPSVTYVSEIRYTFEAFEILFMFFSDIS